MKYIIAIAYLLLSFNMNALELDSVRRKEIVREGQAEFCQLLEYNSHCTSPDQMKFTVVIDGNEPTYSRVIEKRVDTTGIQILSATCYDSLNAVLSRVYRDYHIEMYMIVIKTFDIAVTTPLTQPIVINNLFNNPLYDEQTNLAQLRNWHKGITEDIIQNTLSPRNRDCLVYSRAWYRGALIPGSIGEWMFSKRVCHYANTRTYPKLDELHTYFASRIINNPSVQNSGFEYSLQAVSREFAESAKYISLKAAILTTFTSSSLNSIFAQFNESIDYGGLTEQERIHALAVYSGYTMFDNGISREEYYACKIVENTPRAQVAAFFLHLDDVSPLNSHPNYNGNKPNQALIVSLIQQINDAVIGNDGDNYARFIRGLTSIMMSDEYYSASRMPQTSEEWIQRQIYWDDWHVFTVAPVGTHDYDITLQATGNIEVSHKVVSNHERHNPPNGGEPYYTAVWDNTYAPYTLQPFDLVIFTNRSSLGMLQVAGAASDEPFIAPAILLKYADDKAFNTNAITVSAIALDIIAIATGPFAIGAAISANNIALAAFEALQFIGSSANIVANIYANPAIQEAVNMFNNIVAAWGISRIAVSGVKYTAEYINAAKSGDLQPVPVSIAQTYRAKYSQVTDWSTMDPAVQGRMRRMDELLAKRVTLSLQAVTNNIYLEGWNKSKVLSYPKHLRPDPVTYIKSSVIANHQTAFSQEGGAFLVVKSWLEEGSNVEYPLGKYVMIRSEMDQTINSYRQTSNISIIENAIGYEPGSLQGMENEIYVFYVDKNQFDFRFPTGREDGANSLWIPGGVTSGGKQEACLYYKTNPNQKIVHNKSIEQLKIVFPENSKIKISQ